jgi:NAD(P)H-hydrate epimerase
LIHGVAPTAGGVVPAPADAMRRADALAPGFGVPLEALMEAAGAAVARAAMLVAPRARWAVLCGKGNNGGDARVAARVLRETGRVAVEAGDGAGAEEIRNALASADWVLDGLLGTSARGPARGWVAEAIAEVNASGLPVLSIDLPSGTDPDSGEAAGAAITARATCTLALPKPGLFTEAGRARAGRVILADIGMPEAALRAAGLEPARGLREAGGLMELTASSRASV